MMLHPTTVALVLLLAGCSAPAVDRPPTPPGSQSIPTPAIANTAPPIAPAQAQQQELQDGGTQQGCHSDPSPEFTHPFTDLSKIDLISPLGVVTHSVIQHSYVWIGRDSSGEAYQVPVYAPVDSELTSAAYYAQPMQDESGQWADVAQYLLRFEVSCEVSYKYDHIDQLVERIAAALPAVASASSRTSEVQPPIMLKAGELIGSTSGTISAHNWDFGVYNRSKPNQFANQARYETTGDLAGSLYADCPYDYFPAELREQMYALLPAADCGSAAQDQAGTIAGTWFDTLAVDADSKLVVGLTVAPGSEFVVVRGVQNEIRIFPGQPTYIDPKDVTSQHCYQDSQGSPRFVYLELLSALDLAFAFGQGPCPAELPAEHEVYGR